MRYSHLPEDAAYAGLSAGWAAFTTEFNPREGHVCPAVSFLDTGLFPRRQGDREEVRGTLGMAE